MAAESSMLLKTPRAIPLVGFGRRSARPGPARYRLPVRPATDTEMLKARWDAVNAELAAIAAGRDRKPEGDEVGERERALLAELDRIEGMAGGLQRRGCSAAARIPSRRTPPSDTGYQRDGILKSRARGRERLSGLH